MQFLKRAILSAVLLTATSAMATAQDWLPDRAYVNLGSYHAGLDPADFDVTRWNEFNPGIVFTWEDRFLGLGYSAGGFINSFGEASPYFSVSRLWQVGEDLSLGPFVSLSNYGANSRHFPSRIGSSNFVVFGGVQANYRNAFLRVQPAPRHGGGVAAVFAGGLTFSLR